MTLLIIKTQSGIKLRVGETLLTVQSDHSKRFGEAIISSIITYAYLNLYCISGRDRFTVISLTLPAITVVSISAFIFLYEATII